MKVTDTRKQRATELLELLTRGPSFHSELFEEKFTPAEASIQYRRWTESWVLHLVKRLVPELRPRAARSSK
jgi:hypothetical protein